MIFCITKQIISLLHFIVFSSFVLGNTNKARFFLLVDLRDLFFRPRVGGGQKK